MDKVTSALWSKLVDAQQQNITIKQEIFTTNNNESCPEACTSGINDSLISQVSTTKTNSTYKNLNNEPNRNYLSKNRLSRITTRKIFYRES